MNEWVIEEMCLFFTLQGVILGEKKETEKIKEKKTGDLHLKEDGGKKEKE